MNTTSTQKTSLTAANVEFILQKCLCACVSNTNESIEVEGFKNTFTFNQKMLQQERHNIEEMLSQLPEEFKDGWSFWELYRTRDGHNWTTTARLMEALMVLGIAINKLSYVLPKNLWWSLPGGAPYLVICN